MKLSSALYAVIFAACCAYAAEKVPEKSVPASDFSKLQSALKVKDPEGFAKVEQLAASDLDAAMHALRDLARKHNMQIPLRRFPGGGDAGPGPRDFGGRRGGPGGGDRHGRGGGRGGMNPLGQFAAESEISAKFPEEYAKVSAELSAAEGKMVKLAERAGVEYRVSFVTQLRELRAKAPDRFAEVERLAKESPMEAMRELMKLARDENVKLSMPFGRGGRGPGGGDRHGRGGDRQAGELRKVQAPPPMGKLREVFPEDMKRYESLRDSDPQAAERLLRELVERLRAQDKSSGQARSPKRASGKGGRR